MEGTDLLLFEEISETFNALNPVIARDEKHADFTALKKFRPSG